MLESGWVTPGPERCNVTLISRQRRHALLYAPSVQRSLQRWTCALTCFRDGAHPRYITVVILLDGDT